MAYVRYAVFATPSALAMLALVTLKAEVDTPTVALGTTFVICTNCVGWHDSHLLAEQQHAVRIEDVAVRIDQSTSHQRTPCCVCETPLPTVIEANL